jgi:hypothetical protein
VTTVPFTGGVYYVGLFTAGIGLQRFWPTRREQLLHGISAGDSLCGSRVLHAFMESPQQQVARLELGFTGAGVTGRLVSAASLSPGGQTDGCQRRARKLTTHEVADGTPTARAGIRGTVEVARWLRFG